MRRSPGTWLGGPLVLLLVTNLGCGRKEPAKPAAPDAAPASAAAPDAAPSAERSAPKPIVGGLGQQLAREAATRSTGKPRVEEVLAGLEAAGVKLVETKQFLAATVQGMYCRGGRTAAGMQVVACEYADPAAAEAGRAHTLKMIPGVAGRTMLVRGSATLTLTTPVASPEMDAERAKAHAAFEKL